MRKFLTSLALVAILFVFFVSPVSASNSWGGYHWARTSNPFTLKLGDNLSSNWKAFLGLASTDWTKSDVLDTTIVAGQAGRNCRATGGRVEVCNKTYGNNGWLGIAQIWVSGLHIVQGTTKMNDTYFNTSTYNKPAWRQLVMCQEVGHTFGLDHQDTIFNNTNLGTCMDYTNDPDGTLFGQLSNVDPNQHDYDELDIIYSHLDGFSTLSQTVGQTAKQAATENSDDRKEWGRKVGENGRIAVYEHDFGFGNKLLTFVVLAN